MGSEMCIRDSCNHGPECSHTFPSAEALLDVNKFSDEQVQDLMASFVHASLEERVALRMAPCPPHVKKNWLLGMARKERKEQQKLSLATVEKALPKVRFIFEESALQWQSKLYEDMLPDEQSEAKTLGKKRRSNSWSILLRRNWRSPCQAVTALVQRQSLTALRRPLRF